MWDLKYTKNILNFHIDAAVYTSTFELKVVTVSFKNFFDNKSNNSQKQNVYVDDTDDIGEQSEVGLLAAHAVE